MHVHSIEGHPQRRYTEGEICYETRKTFETVKTCPEHHSVIIQRSQMKNCSKYPMCDEEQLIYHCFGYNESFVEVCAPINRIVGHYCVLFDFGVGRILPDYNKPCPECPSVYSSNESSTYLSCVAPILSTSTPKTIFDSTSDFGHNVSIISNLPERINSDRSTSEPLVTSTRFMIPGNDTIHTRENSSDSAEIYIIITIFILIVVGIVLYKLKTKSNKKKKGKRTSKQNETSSDSQLEQLEESALYSFSELPRRMSGHCHSPANTGANKMTDEAGPSQKKNSSTFIMDTFDDKSHSTTNVHFRKPEPEDLATIKTKAEGESVSIKGVIHEIIEDLKPVEGAKDPDLILL